MNALKSFRVISFIAAFLPLLFAHHVRADIALLIHGFDSDATTWQRSGINQYLDQQGWHFQGTLSADGHAVHVLPVWQFSPPQTLTADHSQRVYNANLISTAPLGIQAQQLMAMIHWLNQQHPDEPLYLVGHSAGGLVARFAAVQLLLQQPANPAPNGIAGLISIASPHLGTVRAIQAIDAVESTPFFCPGPGWRFMRSMVGGDDYDLVKRSKGLLYQLYPANPRSLLTWLNQQPHPAIPYFSVVRSFNGVAGDDLVPGYSQNMANIPALQDKAITLLSNANHFLNPADGVTIHEILKILTGTIPAKTLAAVTAPVDSLH